MQARCSRRATMPARSAPRRTAKSNGPRAGLKLNHALDGHNEPAVRRLPHPSMDYVETCRFRL